ncbi:hypothetical protein [Treponema sp.]|uniref:hypothetical protein n=1 Tax=Treponema sp. TaxID=166 RepID=UPI0025EE0548|nr:hypothetical protein [Treponema sp.]MCR5218275.1 hypothetical protein [Treponema sp.]
MTKKIISLAASLSLTSLILFTACTSSKVKVETSSFTEEFVSENVKLFTSFAGCGVQIWQNEWGNHEATFALDYDKGCITVGSVGWWGGSFGCYNNGIPDGSRLNLSKIKKVTFEAKASSYGTFYMNFDNGMKNEINVSKNFKQYTIDLSGLSKESDYLFTIGGVRDLNESGTKIYLRNISFYDNEGNETIPEYF